MDTGSATPRDLLRKTIDEQPEDSSYEEIIRELAFAAMVERGLADSVAGRTITHEELRKTIESWRKWSERMKRVAGCRTSATVSPRTMKRLPTSRRVPATSKFWAFSTEPLTLPGTYRRASESKR